MSNSVSLSAKIAYVRKSRATNFQESLRLEGFSVNEKVRSGKSVYERTKKTGIKDRSKITLRYRFGLAA